LAVADPRMDVGPLPRWTGRRSLRKGVGLVTELPPVPEENDIGGTVETGDAVRPDEAAYRAYARPSAESSRCMMRRPELPATSRRLWRRTARRGRRR